MSVPPRHLLLPLLLAALAAVVRAGPPPTPTTWAAGPVARELHRWLRATGAWPWPAGLDPDAASARIGFAHVVRPDPRRDRLLVQATWSGAADLPWGRVRQPDAATVLRPDARLPDRPLPDPGRSVEVPSAVDGLFGVLYRELASTPAPASLLRLLAGRDPRLGGLVHEPTPGVRFGIWVRRAAWLPDAARLVEHLEHLGDGPRGDRLLVVLGADRLAPPPEDDR